MQHVNFLLGEWVGLHKLVYLIFWVIFMQVSMILEFPASYTLPGGSHKFTCCIFKLKSFVDVHLNYLKEYL